MKLTTFLLLATSFTALAATEEQINKKFTVHPGGRVVVDVDFGSIKVSAGAGSEVSVDAWRKVSRKSKSAEEEFLSKYPVVITQDGDTITVRERQKSENGWLSFWGFHNRNEAKYIITVPTQFDARLNTSGGGISAGGLTGNVKAETSGGGLDFARLHGALEGNTSGGGIQLSDCAGDIKIETSGGGIDAAGGSGSLHANTSGGPISVKNFKGPAHVETSGGGISLSGVAGDLSGSTSGGPIEADLAALSGPVRLETSGGGITVRIPANASFDLDAETSGGGVSSDLPVTVSGKAERSQLKGTVNGGGTLVHLRTSGGGIRVERREPQTAERQ